MYEQQNIINQTQADRKIFTTIDGNTLMLQEFEPLQFAVDKILPHGLFIMAGSGKIGKSWLALDIGTDVATGGSLWDFCAEQGDVLYLALEDYYRRLQSRLTKIEADNADISRFHLTTASLGISTGLLEQTHNFLSEHPDTKLIIIDTLERIRDAELDRSMYSYDYRDMTSLREITDNHNLTLLLIHHTRKMQDPDPVNTISGSTGLVGAVDGVFILEKEKRTDNQARLTIANRDTEGFCFRLEFDPDKCKWLLVRNIAEVIDEEDALLCLLVDTFLQDTWSGTATELCDELNKIDDNLGVNPLTVTKQLKNNMTLFKKEFNIDISFDRRRDSRVITLTRQRPADCVTV